jgi:hypothetical protein
MTLASELKEIKALVTELVDRYKIQTAQLKEAEDIIWSYAGSKGLNYEIAYKYLEKYKKEK